MSQSLSVTHYATLVFDCDGVVLNSNKVKTKAFFEAALPYGKPAAEAMVEYHVANGGISRYKKFAHFLEEIVPKYSEANTGPSLDSLLESYANQVREGLMTCEIAPGLQELRNKTSNARWLIASGGDQMELRDVFQKRGIDHFFDGGVFGSPDTKDHILEREIASGNIAMPALFLGDSKYDCQVALGASIDFCFVQEWSEIRLSDLEVPLLSIFGVRKLSSLVGK